MENIPITMIRQDLADIPEYPLEDGYALRRYRPGDKRIWIDIHEIAEHLIKVTARTFEKNFGDDLESMPGRCFFLVSPDGQDVGTITSWYHRSYRRTRWGRIHWVAIIPDHRGRGLSKSIMTVAMRRLRKLGHRRAMLTTATPRIPAIKTYLDFGFVPDLSRKGAWRAWRLVGEHIPHPVLAEL